MIQVSALYPAKKGSRFDMDYYCKNHTQLLKQNLGAALKGVTVQKGIAGLEPGSPAPYQVMGHLLFDSVESFQAGFKIHGQALLKDIANFTDVEPVIQISEVMLQDLGLKS